MNDKRKLSDLTEDANRGENLYVIKHHWRLIDWAAVVFLNYPVLKLAFEENEEDWALYSLIDLLSKDTGFDFIDAAAWILREALGPQYEFTRQMELGQIPWKPCEQYVCRIVSLQVCKWFEHDITHTLAKVDRIIWSLLMTDEEIDEHPALLGASLQ